MSLPYTEKILKYFTNPSNVGEIDKPDAMATEGSPACGDMVKIFLRIDKKNNIIKDIKFKSYGCASNIATASIVTEMAKGKNIEEAKRITWQDADKLLGGLPPVKVHCAVLAVDALKTAIENYEHQNNLLKEKIKTDKNIVVKRLSHVINPITGLDIMKNNFVKDIKIEKNKIIIYINLSKSHRFALNIEEEIKERLLPLWDIEKVEVMFEED